MANRVLRTIWRFLRRMWMGSGSRAQWKDLADDIGQACLDVLGGKTLTVTEKGRWDPKVVAIKLMSRALQHFRGVFLLLENDLVVEARVLVRCCWEDAFWIADLAMKGDEFVEQMRQDDMHSHKLRGEHVLASGATIDSTVENRIKEQLRRINKEVKKGAILSPNKVALNGVLHHGYLIYSQLSADAAHPTLTALSRYEGRSNDPDGGMIEVVPPVDPAEVIQTIDWACSALIGVCVGLNQALEGTPAGLRLEGLADRYQALSARK